MAMIPNKNTKSLFERRWRVVITWKYNPNKGMRWVASKCGETDENAWAEMKRLVMEKGPLRSLEEVERAVFEAWASIPNAFFENNFILCLFGIYTRVLGFGKVECLKSNAYLHANPICRSTSSIFFS